jgi:integrase
MHAVRQEIQSRPPVIYKGRDDAGERILARKGRQSKKSGSTLNRYMAAMSAVFTWAIEQRQTPKGWANPCRGLPRLEEPKGRVRFLDEAERAQLFAACKASTYPRLYALVLAAMLTGARKGELLELRWRDVDLIAGVARLGATKNGDRRSLVLLPQVVQALEPLQGEPERYVFGSMRAHHQRPAVIDTAWREALERAGVSNFRFHDLRHCCASYMAQQGHPLNVIAEVLGHRNLEMTRRYAHLTTQTKASAMRQALGNIGL